MRKGNSKRTGKSKRERARIVSKDEPKREETSIVSKDELKREEAGIVSKDEPKREGVDSESVYASQSEVARIREQIEQEYRSAELLRSGFAITARHDFITARMNTIGRYRKQLVPLVGDDEATRMMCESCAKVENE